MSKFTDMIDEYRTDVLGEAEVPAPEGDASAVPAPDMAAAEEPEAPSPEDIVNELEKSSKKPWATLAGVLGRAMEYHWTDDEIQRLNDSMPGGLTIRDFVNGRTSPNIKDPYDANTVSAAVKMFDQVDALMKENDMSDVIPAEER